MEYIDTLIIGAGVVGLATAAKLSEYREVFVIEQNMHFGEHTSSRNSEVVHAGIYYPTNSLKAKLCVRGKELLYRHCSTYHVPVKRIGKVLIAQSQHQIDQLEHIRRQARLNGVTDLTWLSDRERKVAAPQIASKGALFSPSTGIIDSHQLMLSFISQLEKNQGHYVANTQFLTAQPNQNGFIVTMISGGEKIQLQCKHIINAGGLFAQKIANNIQQLPSELIPRLHYCRGHYFSYQAAHPFQHLIYPLPEKHGLGIHATVDLAGQLKFGPDTEFIDSLSYHTDADLKNKFVSAIRQYWPQLDESKLHVDYVGIRPKLTRTGAQDFMIQCEAEHKIPGLINLFGIESPGLTASMAIAESIAQKLTP